MKTTFTKSLLVIVLIFLCSPLIKAQDLGQAFVNAEADAVTYLSNYFEPAVISASNGVSNGWNNTAKPHKLFGFDLTTTISIAGIPDAAYNFNFRNSDYNNLRLSGSATEAQLPTFAGGSAEAGTQIEVYDDLTELTTDSFGPPSGIGLDDIPVVRAGVPIPFANIGVGLPKNTELRVRFLPISNIADEISVDGSFGIGVLHDIKQWIPGMKLVPIDIAGFVGFSRFNFTYTDEENNFASFETNATNFQVLASKKLLFFTPYVGVGFNIINANFSFEAPSDDFRGSFDYDDLGGARLTAGFRLKILWVLALNVDYTFQKYNTLNVGFGINIR